jgi:uncharacterized LabA/DUF88 family protein
VKSSAQIERVFVAVDIMNLWYAARDQYGKEVRVNYDKLKKLIQQRALGRYPRQLQLRAYTITASTRTMPDGSTEHLDQPRNTKFLGTLRTSGYEIKNRNLYTEKGVKKPFASDWDVGIAIDAVSYADEYDTFCLVSGDGDYAVLIENLKSRSKYVEVVTFQNVTSRKLYDTADRVIHLTKNELYRQDPIRGEPSSQKSR